MHIVYAAYRRGNILVIYLIYLVVRLIKIIPPLVFVCVEDTYCQCIRELEHNYDSCD